MAASDFSGYNNRNIVLNELIGLRVRVIKCRDRKQVGLHGTVVDESKNTLVVDTGNRLARLVKATSTFRFYAGRKSFIVSGVEINFRPEDRIEKAMKYWKRREM
ncbi:MAG: ribonuclease P protein subunit [Candidatus Micrarchaeota archaeon]|nr:ribonuclease P protein subunit [Candidatus Micrarchaeota archaeon]